jgi:peptidoglycan/LPS O-acetylase OafA/YrhL
MPKQRYEVLDGLRGVAALAVVCLHLLDTFFPDETSPLHHGGLAVDFFFMLSGFVVAHAYDDRWGAMSAGRFFRLRLQRLHPLVVLGATLALAAYVLDPSFPQQRHVGVAMLGLAYGLGLLLLPAPSLPDRAGMTHPLNGPSWSLTEEYLANIAYAAIGPRIGRRGLVALVIVSGVALAAVGATHGTLQYGWDWPHLWMAPIRTVFPFFAGMLLYRSRARLRVAGGWLSLSALLMAVFAAPLLPTAGAFPLNGIFEAALVIGVFPLLIAAGASAEVSGRLGKLCRLCGQLSYPIYIVHFPLVRLYSDWVWARHPSHIATIAVGAALALAIPVFAWIVLKLYDEPVRAWLASRGGAAKRKPAGVGRGAPMVA